MSTELIVQLVSALAPTLMALAALITSIKNGNKADRAIIKANQTSDKITEIHLSLNSRLSELLDASISKGRIEERNEQRQKIDTTAAIANTLKLNTAQIAENLKHDTAIIATDVKAIKDVQTADTKAAMSATDVQIAQIATDVRPKK